MQRHLEEARQRESIPDVLMLLEHPPVYTRGRRSTPEELPMGREWYEMQGVEVRDTDRGGRVTYHGPGQLVAYPIVSLKPYRDDVHEYVRRMERVVISSLGAYLMSRPAFPQFRTAQCCAIEDGKPTFTARADLDRVQAYFVD